MKPLYDIPWPLRLIGLFGIERGPNLRFRWGELALGGIGFALGYAVYHDRAHWHINLLWPDIYIRAPMLITQRPGTEDWMARYGFSWVSRSVHLNWRTKCKIVHMPWEWKHVRHDVIDIKGQRHSWQPSWSPDLSEVREPNDGRHKETHSYEYRLRSGEIQNRRATIHGEEREWRWKWFTWLRWPRKVNRVIDVSFDDEVGERTGTWKGGVLGTSSEWLPGETMESALRRMERERVFR